MRSAERTSKLWLALAGCVVLFGCERPAPKPADSNSGITPMWQSATPTAEGGATGEGAAAVPATPEIRAQLKPRRYTTFAAEISAKINSITVAEGSAFSAGERLVIFECAQQRAQLDKARAELEGAERNLGAHIELDKLNAVGQLELDLARAAVALSKAEVANQSAVVDKCEIRAPFSGRVTEQKAREQQFVQAGQPLLDVIDDEILELEFIVPSRWLAWVKPDLRFTIAIDETGKTYPARFTRIGAQVDAVSQSIKVFAAIDGRFPELTAGMSGRIDAQPEAVENEAAR